jgi:hypothetical protein
LVGKDGAREIEWLVTFAGIGGGPGKGGARVSEILKVTAIAEAA